MRMKQPYEFESIPIGLHESVKERFRVDFKACYRLQNVRYSNESLHNDFSPSSLSKKEGTSLNGMYLFSFFPQELELPTV